MPNSTDTSWTPTRDAELANFIRLGLTTKDIALRMDTTKNAIIGRIHRTSELRKLMIARSPDLILPYKPEQGWSYPPVGHCHWPEGDPSKPGFHFCGVGPVVIGRPYCGKHEKLSTRHPQTIQEK